MSGPARPTDLTFLALQRLEQEIDDVHWQDLLRHHGQDLEDLYQEHARLGRALGGLPRPAADAQREAAIINAIPWRVPAPRRRFFSPARLTASALVAACVAVLIVLDHTFTEPPTPPPAVHQFTAMAAHAPAEVADLSHGPAAPAPAPVVAAAEPAAAQAPDMDDKLAQRRFGDAPDAARSAAIGARELPDARLRQTPPPASAAPVAEDATTPSAQASLAANEGHKERLDERGRSQDQKARLQEAGAAPAASAMAPAPDAAAQAGTAVAPPPSESDLGGVASENRVRAAMPGHALLSVSPMRAAAAAPWSCALSLSRRPDLTAVVIIAATQAGVLPRGAVIIEGSDAQGRVIWRSPAVIPREDVSLAPPMLRVRQFVTIPADGLPEGLQSFQARIPGVTSSSVALSSATTAAPAPAAAPAAAPGH